MIRSDIITWQPVLTDHQAFTYEALAKISGFPVIAYVSNLEDSTRKSQGWRDTKVNSICRRLIPQQDYLRYCYRVLRGERNSIHIFASPFQEWRLIVCLFLALFFRIEVYLISEPYSSIGEGYLSESNRLVSKVKATLRPFIYRLYAFLIRDRVSGIFAISTLSVSQYLKAGVGRNKLFPFGYFIPRENPVEGKCLDTLNSAANVIKLVFVGSLIKIKGLDILVKAMALLRENKYKLLLDIYGPGDISRWRLDDPYVSYKGVIPFGNAQSVIANYDLLVLPSRYDGWGVVVNEAICAGVPVVTSDACGAGVTAAALGAGLCFKSGDAHELAKLLMQLTDSNTALISLSSGARLAASTLQPEAAAQYLFEVINAPSVSKNEIKTLY